MLLETFNHWGAPPHIRSNPEDYFLILENVCGWNDTSNWVAIKVVRE